MALDRDLVVVMGDRRYRVERAWGEESSESPLRLISSIAVDARGRVYAYQRADPPVVVFDRDGRVNATWGEDRISDPHGLTIAPDGRVLLVDRDAHQLLIFTSEGEQVGAIGTRHSPKFQAPFNHPTGVAVAPDGDIYVSDGYGNSVVHRFAADGTHRATWGRPGSGPGEFTTPHAVVVDARDRVLVADRENNRVQLFDREGTYLGEWGDLYHPDGHLRRRPGTDLRDRSDPAPQPLCAGRHVDRALPRGVEHRPRHRGQHGRGPLPRGDAAKSDHAADAGRVGRRSIWKHPSTSAS